MAGHPTESDMSRKYVALERSQRRGSHRHLEGHTGAHRGTRRGFESLPCPAIFRCCDVSPETGRKREERRKEKRREEKEKRRERREGGEREERVREPQTHTHLPHTARACAARMVATDRAVLTVPTYRLPPDYHTVERASQHWGATMDIVYEPHSAVSNSFTRFQVVSLAHDSC